MTAIGLGFRVECLGFSSVKTIETGYDRNGTSKHTHCMHARRYGQWVYSDNVLGLFCGVLGLFWTMGVLGQGVYTLHACTQV